MTGNRKRPKVLVEAYLCQPGRGSERGAGWGLVRALNRFADCTVVTGPESGDAIDAWLGENPGASFAHVTVPEPGWAPPLKRTRIGEFLVYLGWQRRIRRSEDVLPLPGDFDVAFHATLSAFWLPSAATNLGLPSVWGPVGGAVTTPRRLWRFLGWKGVVVEVVDWMAVRIMSLFAGTRHTWRSASVRIVQNDETLARLPANLRSGTVVMNHALLHEIRPAPRSATSRDEGGYVAWVSPMESRKGPELAIRVLATTAPGVRMIMVGDGPERTRIEGLARELGVEHRVSFEGTVPHDRALQILRDSDVALFTGMREEGGLALAEAMLMGTPIVLLANGGSATVARAATDPERVSMINPTSSSDTIGALGRALEHQIERERTGSSGSRTSLIDQDAATEELARLVEIAAQSHTGRST